MTTHTPLSIRRLAGLAAVAALVAVPLACGDDDDAISTATAPSDTTAAAGSDTTVAGSSGNGEAADFCAKYDNLDQLSGFDNLDASASPDQIRAALDETTTAVDDLIAAAPAEVRGDVETVGNAFSKLKDALEATNYQVAPITTDAELEALFTNGEFETAGKNMDAYYQAHCT